MVRLATAWSQRMAQDLRNAWRYGGRIGRLTVAALALCLAVPLAAVAGLGLGLAAAEPSTTLAGLPVPHDQMEAINKAALSCPMITAPRLAGQLMATSGFDPQASPGGGRSGVAGLTEAMWKQWAPEPTSVRSDVAANIMALAHAECDLVGQVRAAGIVGDLWHLALAAFHSGLQAVTSARGMPDAAAGFVDVVAAYAEWYAQRLEFGGPGTGTSATSASRSSTATTTALAPPTASMGVNADTGADLLPRRHRGGREDLPGVDRTSGRRAADGDVSL